MSFDMEIGEKQSCEEQSLRVVPSQNPSMLKVYLNLDENGKQEANSNIVQDSTAITIDPPTNDNPKQLAMAPLRDMVLTQSSLNDLQEDMEEKNPVLRQDTFKSVPSGKVNKNYKTSSNFVH